MANEFKHKTVGTQMTQSEYEAVGGHVLDSQAAGDLVYASSTTQLSRLGIGTAGKVLQVNSGASAPEWTAALTGVTSIFATDIKIGEDDQTKIDFETADEIHFYAANVEQVYLADNIFGPQSDSDVDLGTTGVRWKDAYIDTITTTGNITPGGSLVSSGDFTIDSGADIVLDADGADVLFKDAGTTYGSATNNSGNLIIKSGTTTALTFTGANVAVAGDLTITGDDLVMGTNTAGMLLVADGTNFNPTAVGSLSEISSIADDDVFLAVDTSGGGLKKVARSQVVSGLATSSGIASLANDDSPELGGDLDVLTHGIVTGASNRNIALTPHGTGVVRIDGTNGIDMESGAISIKNGGSESYIRFYCESSNAHYTQVQAAPHASYSGNVTVVLPATADTLVGKATTDTLTNKTLTSPKINEDVALTSTATELNLLDGVSGLVQADFTKLAAVDSTATELNIVDGNTTVGTTAVADGDGIVTNDGGTMRQTTVQTFATYFGSEITAMSNLVTTGTLNSGAISSGFGNIDIGSSTFDTTGAVSTGALNPAGDVTIADGKHINLTTPLLAGSDHTATGTTAQMLAGAAITAFQLVCIHSTTQEVVPADASAAATSRAIGIALADISDTATGTILLHGFVRDDTFNFTTGGVVFLSETTGALTQTAPTTSDAFVQAVGIALEPDVVFINPSVDVIQHA